MSKLSELMKASSPKDFARIIKSKPSDSSEKTLVSSEGVPAGIVEHKFTPAMPRINVLPDEIVEKYATGALIKKMVTGGVVVAVLIAATAGAGVAMNISHASKLATLDQQGSALQGQITALQPYQLYKDGVEAKRSSLSAVLNSDVDMSKILDNMNNQAESNSIDFKTVDLSLTSGGTSDASGTTPAAASGSSASCFNPDPFSTTATIGCITITGTSSNKDEVNGFFVGLDKIDGFENSFISSITNAAGNGTSGTGANVTTFEGSISITSKFYSSKYADLASPLDQIIAGKTDSSNASLSSTLKKSYPKVFPSSYTDSAITTVASQTCSGLSDGTLKYNTALADITQIAATNKATTDQARDKQILSTIVNTNCPANSGLLEG